MLYCILFLHQTTTDYAKDISEKLLYCILFLHQTTTSRLDKLSEAKLYCILFLHQTTTAPSHGSHIPSCIASSFYIKPQPLYECVPSCFGCIASSFYIKPQQLRATEATYRVVLHPLSTSNHNLFTSVSRRVSVVLHPLSTSNHNFGSVIVLLVRLYCILFLHQTTTKHRDNRQENRLYCILFLHQTTTPTHIGYIPDMLYCILFLHQTTTSDARHFDFRALNSQ